MYRAFSYQSAAGSLLVIALVFAGEHHRAAAGPIAVQTGFTASDLVTNLPRPVGLTLDDAGNLYAGFDGPNDGDVSFQSIRKIPLGTPSAWSPFGGTTPDPDAVLFDAAGHFGSVGSVLVGGIESLNSGRISQIAPNGTATILLQNQGLGNPNHLAFDSTGRLFVANTRPSSGKTPNNVLVIDGSGVNVFATFDFDTEGVPGGIAVDKNDNVYVALGLGNRIAKFSSSGALIDLNFATGFTPAQLSIDNSAGSVFGGALFATQFATQPNSSDGKVWRIDLNTGVSTVFAEGFADANGITISTDGTMYVSETTGDRIVQISASLAAVPEPSTFVLFAMGGVALLGLKRRPMRRDGKPQSAVDAAQSAQYSHG